PLRPLAGAVRGHPRRGLGRAPRGAGARLRPPGRAGARPPDARPRPRRGHGRRTGARRAGCPSAAADGAVTTTSTGTSTGGVPAGRIRLRRAYEPPARGDGYRVLVDRGWPRGVDKATLALDEWCRDVAPSTELRRWFGHDPARWEEFRARYRRELEGNPHVARLAALAARGRVTLVYGAADTEHNQAVVLRGVLLEALGAS